LAAVAEDAVERGRILRRGDDEDVADPAEHQGRQRIIDHRLVVDRQELLGDRKRQRMQPRAGAASENDALAAHDTPAGARRPATAEPAGRTWRRSGCCQRRYWPAGAPRSDNRRWRSERFSAAVP